ncbi:periplasmic protein thiol/disulphide oxidoreductase DsbE [Gluconacetobacter diazotrophicus PA1 5]|uniref:Redoxin domain-containing protein n=3 Tax=Gluconacetobacter diazotrophicus TaxID=33996 RepID=A0A7W4FET2_GLUDI|nr:redoxin domain-containing protein [Gluconacetobacter diazotrophicus]ACI52662.1 periplasmic protein thiol/disulphide oxidoreductase DsbE [Gluconacetobacter diazotrophicus PA1 5]MBB2156415.1 redoxin domain-containing protein [Gluconacetobacter diazotrophicus]TWB06069.1 cytochrome c biogenesis protein CcmG/thiol:disulfide interchange protein DsbE [Gluconacetobacter diazotrophicus]CAP57385.1 putative thioredoxin disulfide isomerase [Gluconacetobacter diazotrophicus PA1 5]
MTGTVPHPPNLARRRLLMAAPLAAAGVAGVAFWRMLSGMSQGSFDPHDIHAPVLNRPVPDFKLPDQTPGQGFGTADLRALQAPVLVNFFASWCIPCVAEMPELNALKDRLPIWGIAYKDKPDDAAGFVKRAGNPYARIAGDLSGMTAIDWGVSGVPESFLVGPGGVIRWHSAAALDADTVRGTLLPLAASLHS